jgi:hypothetical protein
VLLIGPWASGSGRAADPVSKAVFAYGAINAYMTSTWIAREQGFFRKHNVTLQEERASNDEQEPQGSESGEN